MPALGPLSKIFPPSFFILPHSTTTLVHCRSLALAVTRLLSVNSSNYHSFNKHTMEATMMEITNTENSPKNSSPSPKKTSQNENVSPIRVRLDSSPKKIRFELAPTPAPKLLFAKLSDKAHPPTKGSKFAAGYDLKSAYEYVVPARGSCLVKTDIQIQVPQGTYGRVAPRSGLALKNKIDVGAGVIDEDYRGNVGVILFNLSDEDFKVAPGDRVAQLICEKIEYPDIEELKTLDESERGAKGFGSTGVSS